MMKLTNYQTDIKLGLLLWLVALAMPDLAFAQCSTCGIPPGGLGPGGGGGGVSAGGLVDFGGGQATFAGNELSYAPGFAAAIAYVAGTIFCFSGILKLKQHAESPVQTPLSHGLARLVTAGALLALPTITSLAQSTLAVGIGTASAATAQSITPVLQ
jgi:hypothetical protein